MTTKTSLGADVADFIETFCKHHRGDLAGIYADGTAVKDVRAAIAAHHIFANKETHDAAPAFGRFFSPVPR